MLTMATQKESPLQQLLNPHRYFAGWRSGTAGVSVRLMAALSMSPQTTAVQHRESDMPQLFNNTPTRRLSTTNEKRRLPSLETLINKKLPPLPLSVTLTPSTSVLTPPMKRTNSGCSDVSSIVSNARRNSIDPVDGIADLAELSDIEDGFLRAVSLDMIPEVKRYLLDKVDINIKNGFKRWPVNLIYNDISTSFGSVGIRTSSSCLWRAQLWKFPPNCVLTSAHFVLFTGTLCKSLPGMVQ